MAEAQNNNAMTIAYFPAPGRAETGKLCLQIGGIAFNEDVVGFQAWPELKPKTPWLSLPFATLSDKTVIGQSRPIGRYCARLAGLYPTNKANAAKADQIYDFCEDIMGAISKKGDKDADQYKATREAEIAEGGKVYNMFMALDKFIGDNEGDWSCGPNLSMGDIAAFVYCNNITSGFWDFYPKPDIVFQNMKNIQDIRTKVANIPAVQARYTSDFPGSDQGAFMGFKEAYLLGLNSTDETKVEAKDEPANPEKLEGNVEVTYFAAPGRAELLRLLLTLGDVDFKNTTLDGAAWGAKKASNEIPLGNQLPVMTLDDGTVMTQSMCIARYTAAMTGMIPEDALQAQQCDAIVNGIVDIAHAAYKASKLGEGAKAALEALFHPGKDDIPQGKLFTMLQKLEAKIGENFAVGESRTWADVQIFTFYCMFAKDGRQLMEMFKKLTNIYKAVKNDPKIKARYEGITSETHASFKAGLGSYE